MKYADFKEHEIKRTCKKSFDDESKYRKYLREDFQHRCCYCNMDERLITQSYHIDHFIPKKAFKGKRDSLKTDYNNLMWACPKCNMSKSGKYEGDLIHNPRIENELFYNPVETDYNSIFYRNELGGIDSDDPKGRDMIHLLKLYRPIHNLVWLVERLDRFCETLERQIKKEADPERKKLLESAHGYALKAYRDKEKEFKAAYRGEN